MSGIDEGQTVDCKSDLHPVLKLEGMYKTRLGVRKIQTQQDGAGR